MSVDNLYNEIIKLVNVINIIWGVVIMTIAEVSKKYDLTPDTLRYYERIGLLCKQCTKKSKWHKKL